MKKIFMLLALSLITSVGFALPLNGVYYVGLGADFESLTEVRTALQQGISGPVEFKLLAGIYEEQVAFDFNVDGSSEANTITINSATENPNDVKITYLPTLNMNVSYIIHFSYSANFIIKNLYLKNQSTIYGIALRFTHCSNILVENCILEGPDDYSNMNTSVIMAHGYQEQSNITIRNNVITNGYYGIEWTKATEATDHNNIFTGNTFENIKRYVFSIENQDSLEISNNYFFDTINNISGSGLDILNTKNSRIFNNTIYCNLITSSARTFTGIMINENDFTSSVDQSNLIYNNFISIKSNNELNKITALHIENYNWLKIYYNTTYIGNGSAESSSVYLNNNSTADEDRYLDIKNNNFTSYSIGFVSIITDALLAGGELNNSDYNNYIYDHPLGNTFLLGTIIENEFDVARSIMGSDSHSLNEGAFLVGEFNLHATGNWGALIGWGTPIEGITTDIDGQPRNSQSVEIGADELEFADIEILEILAPLASCTQISDNPSYKLRNAGSDTIFSGDQFTGKIFIASSEINTEEFTVLEDWIPGEERNFTFAEGLSIEIPGNYFFTFTASHSEDEETQNDTLIVSIPLYQPADILVQTPNETVCLGSEIVLFMYFTGTPPFTINNHYNNQDHFIEEIFDYDYQDTIAISGDTEFQVSFTDSHDCSSTAFNLNITVFDTPSVIYSGNDEFCSGSPLNIAAELVQGDLPWTIALNYLDQDTIIENINSNTLEYQILPDSDFEINLISVIDANGCLTNLNQSSEITMNALPQTGLISDISICASEELTLEANPGMINYLWYGPNNFESSEFSITISGQSFELGENEFFLTVSDTKCSNTDSIIVTIDVCDNISNNESQSPEIWPNPAIDYIVLKDFDNSNIKIVNATGQIMKEYAVLNNENKINISDLMPGIYFIVSEKSNRISFIKL